MVRKKGGNIARRAAAGAVALLFLLSSAGCDLSLNVGREDGETPVFGLFATSAELSEGAQMRLFPGDVPEDVFFVVENDLVASVTEEGVATAVRSGETLLTASNGRTMRSCSLSVKPATLGVRALTGDACIAAGDKITFTEGLKSSSTQWTSSDDAVFTVSRGVLTAVGGGTATLSVVHGEDSASYEVTVLDVDAQGRQLLWSDEFDGDALDPEKWDYQLGTHDLYLKDGSTFAGVENWGNNEMQYYTRDAVKVEDGLLTITAERKDGLPGGRRYTSARIVTRDRGYWTYGYFEARMKLPVGTGTWPAFWMLPQPEKGVSGTDNRYGGWAASGEIDIMEVRGRLPSEVVTTLHFGGGWPRHTYLTGATQLETPVSEWHTYGLEWRSGYMAWFVDGEEVFRLENTQWYTDSPLGADDAAAPFDVPFYLILNLAVGGDFDGGREPGADFTSAAMQVDYVRVYA